MGSVHLLPSGKKASSDSDGTEPPMELVERVEKLEGHVSDIRVSLAKLETRAETFATREDVANAKNSIIMWVVSAVFLAQILPYILTKLGL